MGATPLAAMRFIGGRRERLTSLESQSAGAQLFRGGRKHGARRLPVASDNDDAVFSLNAQRLVGRCDCLAAGAIQLNDKELAFRLTLSVRPPFAGTTTSVISRPRPRSVRSRSCIFVLARRNLAVSGKRIISAMRSAPICVGKTTLLAPRLDQFAFRRMKLAARDDFDSWVQAASR